MSLFSSHRVYIQYILGHEGISENETADRAAKDEYSVVLHHHRNVKGRADKTYP
jgi:ribonuclease HI